MNIGRWPINVTLWGLCLFPLPKKVPGPFERSDLLYHAISYLIVFLCFAMKPEKMDSKKLVKIAFLLILQGVLIEIIQPYVNRFFEWYDILANSFGVVLGYLIFLLLKKVSEKKPA